MDDISYKNLIGKHAKVQVDLEVTADKKIFYFIEMKCLDTYMK